MNWRTGWPSLRQARRLAVGPGDDAAGAQIRMAREALRAGAAKPGEAGDDMVARPHAGHVVADRLDDPGALVAEHDRPVEREAPDPVDDMQIAVADPGRDGAHQHLAAPRLVDLDRLDRQRLVHLAKHGSCGFHGFRPP